MSRSHHWELWVSRNKRFVSRGPWAFIYLMIYSSDEKLTFSLMTRLWRHFDPLGRASENSHIYAYALLLTRDECVEGFRTGLHFIHLPTYIPVSDSEIPLSKHAWSPSQPKAVFQVRKIKGVKWCVDVFLPCAFPDLKEFMSAQIFHLQNSIHAVCSGSVLGDM